MINGAVSIFTCVSFAIHFFLLCLNQALRFFSLAFLYWSSSSSYCNSFGCRSCTALLACGCLFTLLLCFLSYKVLNFIVTLFISFSLWSVPFTPYLWNPSLPRCNEDILYVYFWKFSIFIFPYSSSIPSEFVWRGWSWQKILLPPCGQSVVPAWFIEQPTCPPLINNTTSVINQNPCAHRPVSGSLFPFIGLFDYLIVTRACFMYYRFL